MNYEYTEHQKMEIESFGISLEQFDRFLYELRNEFDLVYEQLIEILWKVCGCISDSWQKLKELIEDIQTVEVKINYRIVKSWATKNIVCI